MRLRSSVAGIIDLLFFVVTGAGIWIALTGGGQVQLSEDSRLSLTSVNNPVAIATVLAALRYLMRTWGPLLWVIDHARWMRVVDRAVSVFLKLAHTDSWVLLALGCVGVVTIKVTLAATHPGFFSGDDVEIHGMTLGRILELDWPVWDLRSSIFPMGVVYPSQAVAYAAGFRDTFDLVLAGRMAVAVLSTASLLMLWNLAAQEFSRSLALVAVLLLAINKAHMAFGSTELPRPVSTVLVLGAFLILRRWSTSAALLSGALIGVAHTFRFSEGVFVLPFILVLLRRGDWARAAACAGAAVLTAGVLLAVADHAYWGHAFFSLHNAWNYTVVDGLSSRGYQAPWWYLANVGSGPRASSCSWQSMEHASQSPMLPSAPGFPLWSSRCSRIRRGGTWFLSFRSWCCWLSMGCGSYASQCGSRRSRVSRRLSS